MNVWEWLTLASVCFAGAASPGPSLAVVVAAVVGGGRAAGLSAAWAHALGVGLYAAMTVAGIASVVRHAPRLLDALQIAGALYLLWLAFGLLRSHGTGVEAAGGRTRHAARDGFAVAFLNPKLAIFMLALFSQFVGADADLATGAILVATATVIDGCWYSLVTLLLSQPRFLASLQRRALAFIRSLENRLPAASRYASKRLGQFRRHAQSLIAGATRRTSSTVVSPRATRAAPLTRSEFMPSAMASSRRRAVLIRVTISSWIAGELTSTS